MSIHVILIARSRAAHLKFSSNADGPAPFETIEEEEETTDSTSVSSSNSIAVPPSVVRDVNKRASLSSKLDRRASEIFEETADNVNLRTNSARHHKPFMVIR